jgi:hypothetical protein
MTHRSRISVQIAITATLAALLAFSVPAFVDRREYTAAVRQTLKNPSPENDATLRCEAEKRTQLAFITKLSGTALLFLLLNTGWLIAVRLRFGRRKAK